MNGDFASGFFGIVGVAYVTFLLMRELLNRAPKIFRWYLERKIELTKMEQEAELQLAELSMYRGGELQEIPAEAIISTNGPDEMMFTQARKKRR